MCCPPSGECFCCSKVIEGNDGISQSLLRRYESNLFLQWGWSTNHSNHLTSCILLSLTANILSSFEAALVPQTDKSCHKCSLTKDSKEGHGWTRFTLSTSVMNTAIIFNGYCLCRHCRSDRLLRGYKFSVKQLWALCSKPFRRIWRQTLSRSHLSVTCITITVSSAQSQS